MSRPAVEVADILRAQGSRFLDRYRSSFDFQQLKAFRAIQNCRTAALGGHLDACPRCGYRAISYNSCRNRTCPKCQGQARERWLTARQRELLATSYFHVVFTVPHELNVLALDNRRSFYNLLFSASAATALAVAADPKHLGAEIGITSILHTRGQNLLLHPHVHCVIPAGGLSLDHTHWVRPRYAFFLPVKVLGRVFRGKFIAGLKRLHRRNQLHCAGPAALLADPRQFAALLRRLHRQDWVVYAKPAFGGPEQVLRYLGRYTHRVAISNHRLLAFDGERVTFRWKDYAHGGKHREMTLAATEFLRRFFLHVLPKGFVRIRYFGFLSSRFRTARLALCRRHLLAERCQRPAVQRESPEVCSTWHCPQCGAPMVLVQRLTAAELSSRCSFFVFVAAKPILLAGAHIARHRVRVPVARPLSLEQLPRANSNRSVISNRPFRLSASTVCPGPSRRSSPSPPSQLAFNPHRSSLAANAPAASF